MSIDQLEETQPQYTMLTKLHGIACPCGSCRSMSSSAINLSSLPYAPADGSSPDIIIPPSIQRHATSLGLPTTTLYRMTEHYIHTYGVETGLAIESVLLTKIAQETPNTQRFNLHLLQNAYAPTRAYAQSEHS